MSRKLRTSETLEYRGINEIGLAPVAVMTTVTVGGDSGWRVLARAFHGQYQASVPLRHLVESLEAKGPKTLGRPGWTRTSDPQLRRLMLYPPELRARLLPSVPQPRPYPSSTPRRYNEGLPRASRNLRASVFLFGALNAVLFAGLTPLWEGFDEPFHYGYLQQLWNTRSLPVQKRTCLPEDVWQSFLLAPASYIVKRNLAMVTTFDDYFRLAEPERQARRRQLEQLDPTLAQADSSCPNYESQQAPLAYALLAPINALSARAPLPTRVFRLRLLCALLACLASGLLVWRIAGLLALFDGYKLTAVFLVYASQMFYVATAHVANDWLALPLFLLVLHAAISLRLVPRPTALWTLALALAAGLLTKAYFLAMLPFAFGLVFLCCLQHKLSWRYGGLFAILSLAPAAPWYLRNLRLYHDLSGQQQTIGGAPIPALLNAALQLPWGKSMLATARTSLWEGNSSATTFGATTIWLMLALLMAAACLYVTQALRKRPPQTESVLLAGLGCYTAGLAYSTVLLFYASHGAEITTAPWYIQLLEPPVLCLLLAAMARSGRPGNWLRRAMLWLWTYVICATYVAKLIPLYGGYAGRPVRLVELMRWYSGGFREISAILATTAMIPPAALFALTAVVVVMAVALAQQLSGAGDA